MPRENSAESPWTVGTQGHRDPRSHGQGTQPPCGLPSPLTACSQAGPPAGTDTGTSQTGSTDRWKQQHLGLCETCCPLRSASNPALQSDATWFWAVLWVPPTPALHSAPTQTCLLPGIADGHHVRRHLTQLSPHTSSAPKGSGLPSPHQRAPSRPSPGDCGALLNSIRAGDAPGAIPAEEQSLRPPTSWLHAPIDAASPNRLLSDARPR